jgi:CheY-like chemotaxis protein
LLRTVEGFSVADAAAILGATEEEVEALVTEAGREIAERVATDVLIIEDESLIAQDIEFIARDLGHRIIGVARTHQEAVELAARKRPGLILADIQLADGSSGLNAVNEMLESFDAPVIFITAFPERLLTGERPEPAFLISKPYKVDTVKATISQALFFERKASRAA